MILLSLDFESTGLDFEKDRVIEIGAVLYSTGQKKCLDNFGCLIKTDAPITPEITAITNIHPSAVDRFGYDEKDTFYVLEYMIDSCDTIVAHNGNRFDRRMYLAWANRLERPRIDKLWIDTMIDIKGHEGKRLSYLAADHGIINPFPHSAMADAQTVLTVVEKYDILDLVARAKTPTIVIRARQQRSENELVKKAKFRWNPDRKWWWRAVKACDVEELSKVFNFPFTIEKEVTIEELDGR